MGEHVERVPRLREDGPGARAFLLLCVLAVGAFWLTGVQRLDHAHDRRIRAAMPTGVVTLGGEAFAPLGEPVAVHGLGMRLVGRSNEGYMVYAPDLPASASGEAFRLMEGGGGGGWLPPTAVNGWDPARDRLFLAAPAGRWLPLTRR